ncbi:MAG TPA: sigma-70 family RNA polymerase sigma factor [Roseiflexaceae bacterium]|nr:sigma-70 family RNA polymerase sigma factor [Roseiflexaceae bacterium]
MSMRHIWSNDRPGKQGHTESERALTSYEPSARRGTTGRRPLHTANNNDAAGWEAETSRSGYEETDDSLRQYLRAIGQIPLLTAEQEIVLAKALSEQEHAQCALAHSGPAEQERARLEQQVAQGEEARRQLIQANLRLVIAIARRYTISGMSLMDLIQEGNIGLMHAVEKFDYRKGNRFSTYATWWIRQAIRRAVENQSRTVRLPSHLNNRLTQIGVARAHLRQRLYREPTLGELAAELGIRPDKLAATLSAAEAPLSLERPLNDGTDSCFGDLIEDTRMLPLHDQVAGPLLHEELLVRMERMPARERVRQLEARALRLLRPDR